ncbi:protein-L-isoaspartate O-methyltransferase family protein [Allosediminivita pacifica]|uniref:Protein-L-isoaspartate O-methyltransferase n=1 Tax=Allosediminivita pacifica TaxID=1267769 RepID=A0A2T6ABG7_9RHOB|nr:protein-L-isoaspartate O-methyltransferase [Allosediminivita pacifica]PTX41112.1 protein-L-isoaspartate(D-aspartate) O-methyltransferase [Allosediminivita pacifica]GGB25056.1 protein-L-isoaspartate O-methyltransferase [Allosediminivita pacifica]
MIDFASRRRMMVDTQVRPSDVTEFPIIDAMLTVPREAFVPRDRVEVAYAGENLPLGDGRVILDPRTFAKMLETLDLGRKDLVLDIGMGLGYSSAVIARIAEAVVGLEDDEERADEAQSLLAENDADNVVVQKGTLHEGAPQNGPYDAMIIEGGIETFPDVLADQLKDGGRVVCLFMEGTLGTVRHGYKLDGRISWRFGFNASAPIIAGFEKETAFAL